MVSGREKRPTLYTIGTTNSLKEKSMVVIFGNMDIRTLNIACQT
jgi:hypothetical protein